MLWHVSVVVKFFSVVIGPLPPYETYQDTDKTTRVEEEIKLKFPHLRQPAGIFGKAT